MTDNELIVYTADMQHHPKLKVVVTGRQILPDRADPVELVYLAEVRTLRRIRLQTNPFHHNRGPIRQYDRWVLPVDKRVERYLHQRVHQLETCAEAAVISYLTENQKPKRTVFNISAERARQARSVITNMDTTALNGQNAIVQAPELLETSQPMRPSYNETGTLWARLSDDVTVVVGPDNTVVKQDDFDRVLRAGTYELLIHASVTMLHYHQGRWLSLVLRVNQMRYTPPPPKPERSVFRMLPSFQPMNNDKQLESVDLDDSMEVNDDLDALLKRQRELHQHQKMQRLQQPDSQPCANGNDQEISEESLLQAEERMLRDGINLTDQSALQTNFNEPPLPLTVTSPSSTLPINNEQMLVSEDDRGMNEWLSCYTQYTASNITPASSRKRKAPTAPKKSRKTEMRFQSADFTPLSPSEPLAHSTQTRQFDA